MKFIKIAVIIIFVDKVKKQTFTCILSACLLPACLLAVKPGSVRCSAPEISCNTAKTSNPTLYNLESYLVSVFRQLYIQYSFNKLELCNL